MSTPPGGTPTRKASGGALIARSRLTGSINRSFTNARDTADTGVNFAGTGTYPVTLTAGSTYTITPVYAAPLGGTATFPSSTLAVEGY
jgi:hypothetical protein